METTSILGSIDVQNEHPVADVPNDHKNSLLPKIGSKESTVHLGKQLNLSIANISDNSEVNIHTKRVGFIQESAVSHSQQTIESNVLPGIFKCAEEKAPDIQNFDVNDVIAATHHRSEEEETSIRTDCPRWFSLRVDAPIDPCKTRTSRSKLNIINFLPQASEKVTCPACCKELKQDTRRSHMYQCRRMALHKNTFCEGKSYSINLEKARKT